VTVRSPRFLLDTEHRNFTNIFRIFSVVHTADGLTEEQQSAEELQKFEQTRKYWSGVGTDSTKVAKARAGIWGVGSDELIRDVYEHCCRKATLPDDEIYMFGYSRGAYVVRAVAGLLHNIQAMTSDKTCFEKDYQKGLEIFQDLTRDGGPAKPGEASRNRIGFVYIN